MTDNPWPGERVVVVSDDPPSVEGAVTQLEAWGAQPAVMFERVRALAALSIEQPDMVVLDFGRDPAQVQSLLLGLEEVGPMLPGVLHAAPVVALSEAPMGPRLERDAWGPMHVSSHDDPDELRTALLAALADTSAGVGGGGAETIAASAMGATGRRTLAPALAAGAALAIFGVAVAAFIGFGQAPGGSAVPTIDGRRSGAGPAGSAPSATDTPTTAATPTQGAAVAATQPPATSVAGSSVPATSVGATSVPATSVPEPSPPSTGVSTAVAEVGPSQGLAATPVRLPITGNR
ncbi:MAG: hypothetical protein ACR2NO_02555 [Chloroflexota bacterium]